MESPGSRSIARDSSRYYSGTDCSTLAVASRKSILFKKKKRTKIQNFEKIKIQNTNNTEDK